MKVTKKPGGGSCRKLKTQPVTYPSTGEIDFEVLSHENASTVIFDQKKEHQPSMEEIASAYNPSKDPFVEEVPKRGEILRLVNIRLSHHGWMKKNVLT